MGNRMGVETWLVEELELAKRQGLTLSLLMVDIERFRRHNRTLGHGGGDEIIKTVASLLHSQIRKIDYLARPGGDEFVILLPSTRTDGARAIAERCRGAIATNPWQRGSVTVSIGVATLRKGGDSTDLLA